MLRSGYSFHCAYGHLPDVVSRAKEIGWDALPIADRCSTFAHVQATKLAKAAGLRMVYGVELAVTAELGKPKPILDYWKFLAVDSLRPLHDLVHLATSNPGREPSLLYTEAVAAGGVVKIAGERCLLDEVPRSKSIKDLFLGLSPATSVGLYRAVVARGIPLVAVPDNLFPRREDQDVYRVALGRRSTTQTYPQWIVSDDEWRAALPWVSRGEQDAAINNRAAVLSRCVAEIAPAKLLVPKKPKTLRRMCLEGAKQLGVNIDDDIYSKRLNRELDVIKKMRNEDYFYVIADLMSYARRHMICGPGRGSSAGSLVCYLLGITAVDPIRHGLLFERFLDETRTDSLPDVDLDFPDNQRHLVFDYLAKKYGADRVARLGTVGTFGPRAALNQTCKSLGIPKWDAEDALTQLVMRRAGDDAPALKETLDSTEPGRKFLARHPEAAVAVKIEGHPNFAGQHAAGVVVARDPVAECVAVDARTGATMCDLADAEALGVLKIDALGLAQLSVFERALELVGDKSIDLDRLPLDDAGALSVLNKRHFSGVFQFAGRASQHLVRSVTVDRFEDLVTITALVRPGPDSEAWARRRSGKERVTYAHPLLEPILGDTLGVICFQEQVMRVAREVGGMAWGDVNAIRKAMAKKLADQEMARHGEAFRAGAEANGLSPEVASKVWDDLRRFGGYAFVRAHACAYSLIGYWCCWLKSHHPLEFACATLDAEPDPANQILLLRELRQEMVDYIAVDYRESVDRWTPSVRDGKRILLGPLTAIKGIGPKTVAKILDARDGDKELSPSTVRRLMAAKTDIDSLYPIADAVAKIDLRAHNVESVPTPIAELRAGSDAVVVGVVKTIRQVDENEPERVARRNGRTVSPSSSLNVFLTDDTDEVFCKVHARSFEPLGRQILERAKVGKSIFAFKGGVSSGDFRMIWVNAARYLGELA